MDRATTGIIIFAHGSRVESANEAVRIAAGQMAVRGGYPLVMAAFLELGEPDLSGAVSALSRRGAQRILVVPYFLTLGLHLQRDLPRLVAQACEQNPHLEVRITDPLDGHPALTTILLERTAAVLADWQ